MDHQVKKREKTYVVEEALENNQASRDQKKCLRSITEKLKEFGFADLLLLLLFVMCLCRLEKGNL